MTAEATRVPVLQQGLPEPLLTNTAHTTGLSSGSEILTERHHVLATSTLKEKPRSPNPDVQAISPTRKRGAENWRNLEIDAAAEPPPAFP